MLALEISSTKNFMTHLLSGDTFDMFLLEEATIRTANTYSVDGHINAEFYPAEELAENPLPYEFQPWSELKGLCFNLIKGKHTPLYFKFVLHLKPEKTANLLQKGIDEKLFTGDPDQIKAFVLNIRYDGSKAVLTTGTSYHTFVLSKEADAIWDSALTRYLDRKGIVFENLTSSSSA